MSQYVPETAAPVAIERYDQLVEYFVAACKPRDQWRIGTEYEKVAVRIEDGSAVPFSGPHGIEQVLTELADRYHWEPIREDGRVVALGGTKAAITLEPGGQLELSGEKCDSVHCAAHEFREHIEQIVTVGERHGIVFLGLGMQPVSRLDEIEWVPKRRYRIMAPYMLQVGTLGQRMMKQTATVQVNLDYGSEADATMKMRVAMGIGTLLNAMFANSPICDGQLNGYLSYRGHIWTDTDRRRSGLLRFVFGSEWGFADYVEYALDVPMYFIVRDGVWHDMTHLTFRRFWQDGYRGHRATMADWNIHLTTLFPEARMKGYIELRSVDSQQPELMLAVPALAKGIFYESDCLLAAWDLVKSWTWEERLAAWDDGHKHALRARARGIRLQELARELVAIAVAGCERQRKLDERGEDESVHLERLEELVARGVCPADLLIDKWAGEWDREIHNLIKARAYRLAA
ncbi:MAG TPA: glutamate--cysteine ligase [Candidatus Binatia bacterium]|nr:glutamate--cysteine ligase [Candidatus Binatia bacterium]